MKELKFKIWDKDLKKWLNIEDVIFNNGFVYSSLDNFNSRTPVVRPIILQYTGLKDKNGVEIYEGDIVKVGLNWCMTVYYSQYEQSFMLRDLDVKYQESINYMSQFQRSDYLKVGNVYDRLKEGSNV